MLPHGNQIILNKERYSVLTCFWYVSKVVLQGHAGSLDAMRHGPDIPRAAVQ